MDSSKRKAHVKRIYKVVYDPDTKEEILNNDIFIDVRRFDKLPINFQSKDDGTVGQGVLYGFKWNDDPRKPDPNVKATKADILFENTNDSRKTEKRRIVDPAVKTDDSALPPGSSETTTSIEDNDIYLWIVTSLKVFLPQGDPTGRQGQTVKFGFNNTPLGGQDGKTPAKRTTSLRKIVNNDLNGLKMKGDDGKPFPVEWDVYKEALQKGKIDPDDKLFLTMEFVDKFLVQFAADVLTGSAGQNVGYFLTENKEDVEDFFKEGDPDAKNSDGSSAVIRLDPLQAIVNVGSNIIAVEFKPGVE